MKPMVTYYALIGKEHHRFKAINLYAARQIAKSRANTTGQGVWHEPEVYIPNYHGQFFMDFAA